MADQKAFELAAVNPAINFGRGDPAPPREFANWLGSRVIHFLTAGV
ncbi:MAG TPA: hypothetical protein VEK82_00260 [Stellaceae bacterium]|nr:hypothetical protein [Stellaceae bacterium]